MAAPRRAVRSRQRRLTAVLGQDQRLHSLALLLLFAIVICSFGGFNALLFGAFGGLMSNNNQLDVGMQQNIAFGLWLAVLGLSLLPGAMRQRLDFDKLTVPLLFIGFAAVSAAWSDQLAYSVPKAVALVICTLCALRLACMISIAESLTCLRLGLSVTVTLSVIICVVSPGIGEARWGLTTYDTTHIGLWTGLYGSKQTLGFAAAFLFYLSVMRVIQKRTLLDMAMSALSLLALVKSGCRGAALIDILLIIALLVARSNHKLIPLLTSLILIDVGLGAAQLIFFAYTGLNYIPLFGERIDITGRTNIWVYVAEYWTSSPWLGFGINSFWSNPVIHNQFAFLHKWVIDDCHSGYLGIWIETGLIGYGLFTAMAWKIRQDITVRLVRDRLRSIDLETAFGLLLLTFTTNLTETFFLRSTNLMQAYFSFMLVKLLIERRRAPRGVTPAAPLGAAPVGAAPRAPFGATPHAPFGATPHAPFGATPHAPFGAMGRPVARAATR